MSQGMTVQELADLPPDHQLTLPNSVADMLGSVGQPEGGWPEKLQMIILHEPALTDRAGAHLQPIDFSEADNTSSTDLMSHLTYPDVFRKFAACSEDGESASARSRERVTSQKA
jgi:pyruvate carboxylase